MTKTRKDEIVILSDRTIGTLGTVNALAGIVAGTVAYTTGDVGLGVCAATLAASGSCAVGMAVFPPNTKVTTGKTK